MLNIMQRTTQIILGNILFSLTESSHSFQGIVDI